MKELLKEFYNINDAITILESNEQCSFFYNRNKYILSHYTRSEEEFEDLFLLNEELINKGIPTAKFIYNKHNQFLTIWKEKKYILLEIAKDINKEYTVLDMLPYFDHLIINSKKSILYRNQWAELWSAKMDYFEYQISQLGKDKPVILNSFSYYVGLAENAIAYVNNTTKKYQISISEKITLQRRRVEFPNLQMNYFNPLNYVIDIEVRDIASYFKSLFFYSYNELWIEIKAYFNKRKLSIFGYQLLYARLLYPSFYFDIYERVIEGIQEEKDLIPIIQKASEYEMFLKDMYILISHYASIEKIDWIINKKEL